MPIENAHNHNQRHPAVLKQIMTVARDYKSELNSIVHSGKYGNEVTGMKISKVVCICYLVELLHWFS